MTELFAEWLSDADRAGFLVTMSFELTLAARGAYSDAPEFAFTQLRAFNEMQHQISQHLRHELLATPSDKRYPDSVFIAILRELAAQAGWDRLDATIRESLARNPAR